MKPRRDTARSTMRRTGIVSVDRAGRARRPGFTLLEVLLALALAVLLLGAVFTAMDQTWRLTASGREEMERSQLARALLRKIALDIRAIAFVPPLVVDADESELSGSSSSSPGGSSSAGDSSVTMMSMDEEEVSATSIGVRGNTQLLEMHISRARRDLEFSAEVEGNKVQSRTSDLRRVTYQLGGSQGTGSPGTGLVRTEGDRLAALMVEEKGGAPAAQSAQQVLSAEVSDLQFRYFDGAAWFTVWDSVEAGRLPRAIEVTLGFAPAKNRLGPALSVEVNAAANQYRTVILLPISDPLPEEFVP